MLLALNEAIEKERVNGMGKWFKPLGDDSISEKIKEKSSEIYSYNQTDGWKAVLSHYQPLPRANNQWPHAEYDEKAYENVFGKAESPEDSFFTGIKKEREELLVSLLKKYPKKLIFATGNYKTGSKTDALKRFFIREFQAQFTPFKVGGRERGIMGTFTYNGQKTIVVHTHGFSFGGGLGLDDIKKITANIYLSL